MGKNIETREEKFEDYRNKIETEKVSIEKPVKKTNKPTLNPIILKWKKIKRKKYFIYYSIVFIFALVALFILIYFGVKIYG